MADYIPYLLILAPFLIAASYWLGSRHGFAKNSYRAGLFEAKLREKAKELYASNFALEKARYELVMLASEMNEQGRAEDGAGKILGDKNFEINILKEEIAILESVVSGKQGPFGAKISRSDQARLAALRDQRNARMMPEGVVDIRLKRRNVA